MFTPSAQLTANQVAILNAIHRELAETIKDFPRGCCEIAASIVALNMDLGLHLVRGLFINNGVGVTHCWNRCERTGMIVDLTFDQFESVQKRGILIIHEGSDLAKQHYMPGPGIAF